MSGLLTVVGLGPGDVCLLPPLAREALESADCIVGYRAYVDLVDPAILARRRVIATGMMAEVERVNAAIDQALAGDQVALVCSGDAGIYAMAGLVYECLHERRCGPDALECRVVPGIPAVCAAAAILGAPLTHDFACVSLSDLLTPWPVIEKRLVSALSADFVLAIYNPRSKRRSWQLPACLEAALGDRQPDTPVGLVRSAWRPEQAAAIYPLSSFPVDEVDMFSLVIIGNSATRILPGQDGSLLFADGARMYTPRGYGDKYCLDGATKGTARRT